MTINWSELRPWDGSQRRAFELMCGQLAAYEKIPNGSEFIPKGSPDAGIECYWCLPNGDEWAWQAKFFTSTPEDSQWMQMDDSVRTALERHPRLTRYTFCLPIDRADPRDGHHWFMAKWDERVQKWIRWASEREMTVDFGYWGESEILERLSRQEHRGRCFFWFKKEFLDKTWFRDKVDVAIANVGSRYTPELHVELPISDLFEALGQTHEFWVDRISSLCQSLRSRWRKCSTIKLRDVDHDAFVSLSDTIEQLLVMLTKAPKSGTSRLPLDDLQNLSTDGERLARQIIASVRQAAERQIEETPRSKTSGGSDVPVRREDFISERYLLEQFAQALVELSEFSQSNEAKVANDPALLITGGAGTGKTHLFCDVARRRVVDGLPTVLVLGQHFTKDEPWTQILRQLDLSCSKAELLEALEACAEAIGSRALILIDALNEGDGILLLAASTGWNFIDVGAIPTGWHCDKCAILVRKSCNSSRASARQPTAFSPHPLSSRSYQPKFQTARVNTMHQLISESLTTVR